MKNYLVLALVLIANSAKADFLPFNHDVLCKDPKNGGVSFKISYDRTTHQDLGRPGDINVEINTGFSELANIPAQMGADKPYQRILRMTGLAGQVGNYMQQEAGDPLVILAELGFEHIVLFDAADKPEKSMGYFVSTLRLSRMHEHGFPIPGTGEKTDRDSILVELNGGLNSFGSYFLRFDPADCHTLN